VGVDADEEAAVAVDLAFPAVVGVEESAGDECFRRAAAAAAAIADGVVGVAESPIKWGEIFCIK
jgi:hypothetical protein